MPPRMISRLLMASAVLWSAACAESPVAPNARPKTPVAPSAPTLALEVRDGNGKLWRQLTETSHLAWSSVAAICPTDGVTPCNGSIGAVNLSGWVWATQAQTLELMSRYAPTIGTTNPLSGTAADGPVGAFFTDFGALLTGGCSGWSCSFGAFSAGWTATSQTAGTAVLWSVQGGFGSPSFFGYADNSGINTSMLAGHFMWKVDVSDGTGAIANDDAGSVASPGGAVAVPNVLSNDLLGSAPATLANVNLTSVSSTNPAVTLAADGSVNVAYGVGRGTATLRYRICEIARPTNCDEAIVTVTITGNVIDAVDDVGSTKTSGGIANHSLLANDLLAGGPATLSNVTIALVTTDPALTLTPTAEIRVAAGTPAGQRSVIYEICEIANPFNCDRATVVVTITAYAIDAVNDAGSVQSSLGGTAIADVMNNDQFDGTAATRALTSIAPVGTAPTGLSLDTSDGSVDVAPGTPGGTYTLAYKLCEVAMPANCDQAVATVTVVPQSFVLSKTSFRLKEGNSGNFTVKLSQPPAGPVTVNVAYLAGTMVAGITFTPSTLTFTPANWNVAQTVSFTTKRDSDKADNAGTLRLTATGVVSADVVVNGIDGDRKANFPVSIISTPSNGQTVSGYLVVQGTATSTGGSMADVKFYVDDNRWSTITGALSTTYRAASLDTRTLTNGWHVIEMRATDSVGNDGRTTIKVFVSN